MNSIGWWISWIWNKQPWVIWGSLFLTTILLAQPYLVLNVTPSIQTGLYFRSEPFPLSRGDVVSFCLRPSGARYADSLGYVSRDTTGRAYAPECPSDLVPVAKRVAGLPGDTIFVGLGQVRLPREHDPPPPRCDSEGRPIPIEYGMHRLRKDEYWLRSEHHMGFDSRVFGPVHKSQIASELTPLLHFGPQSVDPSPSPSALRRDCSDSTSTLVDTLEIPIDSLETRPSPSDPDFSFSPPKSRTFW